MKTPMTATKRIQWVAGTVAVLASLLTVGGPLMLAEHYAHTGAGGDASGYYVATRTGVCACQDNPNSGSTSARTGAENS